MRKYLTTGDIARLSGYSRAQIRNRAKAGKIPGQRANRRKPDRYLDSPAIRAWCKTARSSAERQILDTVAAVVLEILAREGGSYLESLIIREISKQLEESKDPDELLKRWSEAR